MMTIAPALDETIITTFTEIKEIIPKIIILCESCELQCAGHGGGYAPTDGGCFCFDGTYLECLF